MLPLDGVAVEFEVFPKLKTGGVVSFGHVVVKVVVLNSETDEEAAVVLIWLLLGS